MRFFMGGMIGALLLAASPGAQAQTQQQINWCNNGTDDQRIEGCTAVIRSGRYTGANLAVAYFQRGRAWDGKNDDDRAIADYSEAVRLNPKVGDYFYNRGLDYTVKGDFTRAIADYTAAINLNPREPDYYEWRGLALRKHEEFDRAISDYTKAIELDPRPSRYFAYVGRGAAYEGKGLKGRAIEDFRRGLAMHPNSQDAKDGLKRLGAGP